MQKKKRLKRYFERVEDKKGEGDTKTVFVKYTLKGHFQTSFYKRERYMK